MTLIEIKRKDDSIDTLLLVRKHEGCNLANPFTFLDLETGMLWDIWFPNAHSALSYLITDDIVTYRRNDFTVENGKLRRIGDFPANATKEVN